MKRLSGITVAALGVLFASCALLIPARVEDIYFRSGPPLKGGYYRLALESLEVEIDTDGPALRENARYIFELLDARYSGERSASATLLASIALKEEMILLGLETRNAVTLEIRLNREDGAEPEILYLFSEETTRSLASYTYLYQIIERAFRSIFP
jgi:hypothetical protein